MKKELKFRNEKSITIVLSSLHYERESQGKERTPQVKDLMAVGFANLIWKYLSSIGSGADVQLMGRISRCSELIGMPSQYYN